MPVSMQIAMYMFSLASLWFSDPQPSRSSIDVIFDVVLRLGVITLTVAFLAGFIVEVIRRTRAQSKTDKEQRVRIVQLEQKTHDEPEKIRFAWDLARVKLETYFDRNLAQVRMIFYVAVSVMLAGFCFVLWGLRVAVTNPNGVKVAVIASASGVITQFISLTFMLIYRSTMLQATQFMSVLERINTVGMTVQILDAMGDSPHLKDATRVDIIRLLLAHPSAQASWMSAAKETDGGKKTAATAG